MGPPAGLSADRAGAGLTPSLMGKFGGMGPPDGVVDCGPVGGILICGLIGLDELGRFDGLVGSAMWSRV